MAFILLCIAIFAMGRLLLGGWLERDLFQKFLQCLLAILLCTVAIFDINALLCWDTKVEILIMYSRIALLIPILRPFFFVCVSNTIQSDSSAQ